VQMYSMWWEFDTCYQKLPLTARK